MPKEQKTPPKRLSLTKEWFFLEELRDFYICAAVLAEGEKDRTHLFLKAQETQKFLSDKLITIAAPYYEHLEKEGSAK